MYVRVTINAPQPHSTVVIASTLAEGRALGLKQLGVKDPPEGGVSTSRHRIDVGEVTEQEFLASESQRLGVRSPAMS